MMDLRSDTEIRAQQDLISRAKAGDMAAFETLYRAFNERIYNFARQMVGSDADAADVAQETFVRAWKSLPKLRDNAAFAGWLYRIALNQSNEFLSRRKRGEVPFDSESQEIRNIPTGTAGPEDSILDGETLVILEKAMSELNPEHRAAIAMHHLDGMDVTEVAEALRVPKGTVLSRLARARAILKRKLAPYLEMYNE